MSRGESPSERFRSYWADPERRAAMHRPSLEKRLEAARRRRDTGERPYPLDNLALVHFDEEPNPREPEEPREPQQGLVLEVLEALRAHPRGLTAEEICELLGLSERNVRGARPTLNNLRNRLRQPILNEDGRFRLLRPGEY